MTEREKTPTGEGVSGDVGRILRIATEIIAPVTLVSALLYFFGRQQMTFFYDYFGVEISALGMTTTDYLLLAQDGLMIPLTVLAMGVLVTLWVRGTPWARKHRPHIETWVVRVAGGLGGLLTLFGLVQAFSPGLGLAGWVPTWIAPLCMAGGVLLLSFAVRRWSTLRRRQDRSLVPPSETARLAERGVVFVLVAAAMFGAVADYSSAVGELRARQFVRELPTDLSVVVHSSTDLQIDERGVTKKAVCSKDESAFRYRYDGLVLMVVSGDQYLLIPRDWERGTSSVVSVPKTDAVRLDHLSPPPGAQPRPTLTANSGGRC